MSLFGAAPTPCATLPPHSTPHIQFRSSCEEASTQTSIAPAQPDSPAPLSSSFPRDIQHSCIRSMDANSNQSRSSRHILCCFSRKETSRKSHHVYFCCSFGAALRARGSPGGEPALRKSSFHDDFRRFSINRDVFDSGEWCGLITRGGFA